MSNRMTALDATFLELEEVDDSAHMHIGGVLIFDPAPGRSGLRRSRRSASASTPASATCRASATASRNRRSAACTGPSGSTTSIFDMERHVWQETFPEPAGEAELRAWAGDYFSERLTRSRPSGRSCCLELADGGWASSASPTTAWWTAWARPTSRRRSSTREPSPSRSPRRRAARRATPPGQRRRRWPADAGEAGDGRSRAGPRRRADGLRAGAAGGRDAPAPAGARAHRAPGRGGDRAADPERAHRRARDDAQRADRARPQARRDRRDAGGPEGVSRGLGGTVNDVVLAATGTAMRRLFIDRGEILPERGIRAMVPVDIRSAAKRLELGNEVTSLFVELPLESPTRCSATPPRWSRRSR